MRKIAGVSLAKGTATGAALVLLLALSAAVLLPPGVHLEPSPSAIASGCACTFPAPPPSWPVAPAAAQATVQRFTSKPVDPTPAWADVAGFHMWLFGAGSGHPLFWAAVNADDGHLVALLDVGAMPSEKSVPRSAAEAGRAATAFVADLGVDVAGLTVGTEPAGVAEKRLFAYLSTWRDTSGKAVVEVATGPSDGAAFWFADSRGATLGLTPPTVGRDEAEVLARRTLANPDAVVVDSADVFAWIDDFGTFHAEWWFQFVAADATSRDLDRNVRVDALTGETGDLQAERERTGSRRALVRPTGSRRPLVRPIGSRRPLVRPFLDLRVVAAAFEREPVRPA